VANIKLIKPNQLYAGLPQGWWLKNYWEYVYPLILRAARKEELPAPGESQAGPVMYAVGKYARAFAEPERLVKLHENTQTERYEMTNTIHRGFVLPFVKFIALESDGDGSSFAELRDCAKNLALKSAVEITFKVNANLKEGDKQTDSNQEIKINKNNAMEYYCESDQIDLSSPLLGQPGNTGTQKNKAASSAFMAIFEPQEQQTYRIDVIANYHFDYQGGKDYNNLHDVYEIVSGSPR
jgi:hypothetical protein